MKSILLAYILLIASIGMAQDIIVIKVKQAYSQSDKPDKLLTTLKILKEKKISPKKSKKKITTQLDGVRLIQFKDKYSTDFIINVLTISGYFEYVEILKLQMPLYNPNDPEAQPVSGKQWYLSKIDAYRAWNITKGDSTVTIGILDNGVDWNHPDLKKNIQFNINEPVDTVDNDNDGYIDNFMGWDMANNDPLPNDDGFAANHGTMVSGLVAARTDNALGMAGVANKCKFLPVKIFHSTPIASYAPYLGIIYAAEQGCKVINLSWGAPSAYSRFEQDVINYAAIGYDAVVVGATWHENKQLLTYPADYENVISVLATHEDDSKSTFQAYHPWIDIAAPGANMFSTAAGGGYGSDNGASFSVPLVAGAAALVRSYYPNLYAKQVAELLRVTADVIDTLPANLPYKEKMGKGRLNIYKALSDQKSPAIRVLRYSISHIEGDTFSVSLELINYLRPTSKLRVHISTVEKDVLFTDSTVNVGIMNVLDTVQTNALQSNIKLLIPTYTTDSTVLCRIGFTDTSKGYVDYQYIYIKKHHTPIITQAEENIINNECYFYPSPCKDRLYLRGTNISNVQISTLTGTVIHANMLAGEDAIDFSGLETGVYLVSYSTEKGIKHQKIIKN